MRDDKLGFRPWYADGFVYCPNCNKPLRHHEEYAIDRPAVQKEMTVTVPADADRVAPPAAPKSKFCHNCGAAFTGDQRFCMACGTKRI